MDETEKQKNAPKTLPRTLCAFAGFFAFAVPAFAVAAGTRVHASLAEIAARNAAGVPESFSPAAAILDSCGVASWALFAVGAAAALWLFALMRKNAAPGTLTGAGRIVAALTLTGALSSFYLAALLFAIALSF